MSGGVDSAVALLRAGPDAIGVTLRLWTDPARLELRAGLLLARGSDRRAGDLPLARRSARDPRPAGRVPARGRRAIRPGLRERSDAEPVHALQRRLPLCRAARLRASARARAGWRRVTTRGSSSTTAGGCSRAGWTSGRTSRTCSPALDPAMLDARLVSARRAAARRRSAPRPPRPGSRRPGARRARRRASSPATTTALFLERRGLEPTHRPDRRPRGRPGSARTTVTGGTRRGSAAGSGSPPARPLYAIATDAATNTVVVGPREELARTSLAASGRLYAPVDRGGREDPLPLVSRLRHGPAGPARLHGSSSTSPSTAPPRGRPRWCTRTTSSSAQARWFRPKIPRCSPRSTGVTSPTRRSPSSSSSPGSPSPTGRSASVGRWAGHRR